MHRQLDTAKGRFEADSGTHSNIKCAVSSTPYHISECFFYAFEPYLNVLSNNDKMHVV